MSHLFVSAVIEAVFGAIVTVIVASALAVLAGRSYGKAAGSLCFIMIASGVYVGWTQHEQSESRATLVYWCFAKDHYQSYQAVLPQFEREHPGVTVDLQLVSLTALAARLQSAMVAGVDVPDLFEIEISQAASLFRGPLSDIQLSDLTQKIHAPGPNGTPSLWDQVVQARFASYTDQGHIFGIPHDVHPVQLAYRKDIFDKAGIDMDKVTTWDQFVAIGHKMTIPGKQYMIEMSDSDDSALEPMLYQRNGGYFDANGNCIMDCPIDVSTMCWYVPLVTGPNRIANTLGLFTQAETTGVEDGYLLCYICPDWRSHNFVQDVAYCSGKMGLMAVPKATPDGRATTTWGGTMVAITKASKHQDLAWQLAMFFYLDKAAVPARYNETFILPPVHTFWNMPCFHQPSAYWSGEYAGERYIKLAPQVPPRYSSPYLQQAHTQMSMAVIDCVHYYDSHGYPASNDPKFVAFTQARLKVAADRVRAIIAMDK
jgi:arabinosaccharide transport system substrate-binding protein